MTHVSYI